MASNAKGGEDRVPMRRGTPGPKGGGVYLSRVQQTRLLDAAVGVVAEEGLRRLSARSVSARAGMSTKTFYDLFADREDCLLAVFDRAVEELAAAAGPAWAGEDEWVARVRGALVVLLGCLERDPDLARVVFVEALGAGPRVLARRAEVLDRIAGFIDEGRVGGPAGLPSLVAAGVVGAAFSIVHSRLLEPRSDSLMELVGLVMATVVLPYRGREVSARELGRPVPELPELPEPVVSVPESVGRVEGSGVVPVELAGDGARVRPTERTLMVLASVGERGGANNREVAVGADIYDDAQISRLLARLEGAGLVENVAGGRSGSVKAWWLTAAGAEFLRTGCAPAVAEPAAGRARSAGRSRAKSAGAGRSLRAGRRGARRPAIKGGALLVGMDAVEYRRVLLLRAAAAAVDEHGYGAVTVAHIAARAKISRRTFYELFVDREQCLLAVMEDIDAQLTSELRAADLDGLEWRERVRQGLWTVLRFFDREPVLARFCVVESARGEERMASYRAELLARIAAVIGEGSEESLLGESSPLVAEGVAGAIVSILSSRLAASSGAGRRSSGAERASAGAGRGDAPPIAVLHGELMALVVLPYLGSGLAQEERTRPAPVEQAPARLSVPAPGGNRGAKQLALDDAPASAPRLRMTYRTALVLEAIGRQPGISNLGVAREAGIHDQGQMSKLLARLQRHGLVQNTGGGQGQGAPNEWRLTPAGEQLQQEIREHSREAA